MPSVMMATYENVYLIPNEYLKLKLPIALMIVTILAFTVCGFIITCCQISRVVKGNPVDCFNDAPKLRKNRAKIKENVSKMPLFIKSAFRNMKQNIARNVMMLVGVFGSVSLLFTSFSVSSSLSISNLSTEKRFDGIYSLMGIVRVFAILLVIVVVVGSLMMILRDRKKEIATFKLLGIKKNTMIWSLVAEIAMVLVVGFMIGIFGGVGLSFLTLKTLHMFGVVAAFSLNFMDIFLSFLIPFLVALLLILYSIIWIKKLNALETLKTIE